MYRIFIIEDDPVIAESIEHELNKWDYEVAIAKDFSNIMENFLEVSPHLVLLDIGLPLHSGFYWCAEIRKVSKVPVIFISSSGDDMSLVRAIHQGGDDFIAKPFDLAVLMAKVQALLRRTYDFGVSSFTLIYKGVQLELEEGTLWVEGEKLMLTGNELQILKVLMENKGRIVSREALMRNLWESESFIDDNTLTVNITRLRKKLDDAGLAGMIKTKKGAGYMVEV